MAGFTTDTAVGGGTLCSVQVAGRGLDGGKMIKAVAYLSEVLL